MTRSISQMPVTPTPSRQLAAPTLWHWGQTRPLPHAHFSFQLLGTGDPLFPSFSSSPLGSTLVVDCTRMALPSDYVYFCMLPRHLISISRDRPETCRSSRKRRFRVDVFVSSRSIFGSTGTSKWACVARTPAIACPLVSDLEGPLIIGPCRVHIPPRDHVNC